MRNAILSLLLAAAAMAATVTPSVPPGKASGSPTAPIQLEVFSDFQCPSCKALFEETLKPLNNDYVATGKVYLIHRDFPLQMHSHSREAAAWANASLRVNKYDQVSTALFQKQSSWAADGKIDAVVAGVLNAEEMKKVRALINDKKVAAEAEQDLALGNQRNVRQTPSMFVTHKGRVYPITGAVNYQLLRKFLDDLLSK
jgi:protein-disulfide isomerase